MSKEYASGLSLKPFKFVREFLGARRIQIEQGTHMYRLGKKCKQCGKSMIHREAISVCLCYCFAHQSCLKNQLKQAGVGECTVVKCRDCHEIVKVRMESQYYLQPNFSVGDLIVLLLCLIICAGSMIYLVNFKNVQRQELRQQELRTHHKQMMPLITINEVIPLVLLFIFGTLFWFCLLGIVFKKHAIVGNIVSTNTEIKVSAFEQLETKIKESSEHCILSKKDEIQL